LFCGRRKIRIDDISVREVVVGSQRAKSAAKKTGRHKVLLLREKKEKTRPGCDVKRRE